jgi:hypothetical protein
MSFGWDYFSVYDGKYSLNFEKQPAERTQQHPQPAEKPV